MRKQLAFTRKSVGTLEHQPRIGGLISMTDSNSSEAIGNDPAAPTLMASADGCGRAPSMAWMSGPGRIGATTFFEMYANIPNASVQ